MADPLIVEAISAVQKSSGLDPMAVPPTQAVADPAAVSQFQAAMATPPADPIPFASQVSHSWKMAMNNRQGLLQRIHSITDRTKVPYPSQMELVTLQYDVASLAFHQEVVAKVADKASNAIQTLIKNQ